MRNILRFRYILVIIVATVGLLSTGCDVRGFRCTQEFVTHSAQVLTPNGQPADSVDIRVRNALTGIDYDVCGDRSICDDPYRKKGTYVIFHDGLHTSPFGSNVVVIGRKDGLTVRADYVFREDECHVRKEVGPDQVMLSE